MTIPILKDRRILLGITGSIAAYKAVDLASQLAQAGAQVDVIMSEAGQRFVTGLTFQSVTGRRAYTDDDLWGGEAHVLHIGLAEGPDLLVIAPITANTINKLIRGMQRRLGVTSIVVTHDIVSAMTVGDRIAFLYDGQILFDGTVEQAKRTDEPLLRNFLEGGAYG